MGMPAPYDIDSCATIKKVRIFLKNGLSRYYIIRRGRLGFITKIWKLINAAMIAMMR
jgi:hypothetical protein